jgi:hypothetical protein
VGFSVSNISYSRTAPAALLRSDRAVQAATVGVVASPAAGASISRDIVSLTSSSVGSIALTQIGASLEAPARISNTLATADQALATIGGLLNDVHSTLTAARPDTIATDQSTIDLTLVQINQLASSTKFASEPLLDGSFTTSLNGSTLSLPSFATTSLGASPDGSNPLSSLSTGGRNSLSGADSAAIVTTAHIQVSTARSQISDFRAHAIQPAIDAGQSALEQLIASPVVSNLASANAHALLVRAQTLLQPDMAATTPNSQAQNVLHLIQ